MTSITSEQRRQYNRFTSDGARKALTTVNPGKEGLQRLFARGDEWQDYLVAGIMRFTAKTSDYGLARSILGTDFISPEEIATVRGLTYTDEQLATFGDTLPAQEMLEWCRDNGMMLVAGPPKSMSLLDIRSVKAVYFYPKQGGWYSEQAQKFARNDKAEPIWIALRKKPVADSLSKNWPNQVVPNAAEAVWGLTTYKAVRGKYLLPNLYVRTSSCDSDGYLVAIGYFDAGGLCVNNIWGSSPDYDLGLLPIRKF